MEFILVHKRCFYSHTTRGETLEGCVCSLAERPALLSRSLEPVPDRGLPLGSSVSQRLPSGSGRCSRRAGLALGAFPTAARGSVRLERAGKRQAGWRLRAGVRRVFSRCAPRTCCWQLWMQKCSTVTYPSGVAVPERKGENTNNPQPARRAYRALSESPLAGTI